MSPKRRFGKYYEAKRREFLRVGRWAMRRFTYRGKVLIAAYGVSLVFVPNTRVTMNHHLFGLFLALLLVSVFHLRLARRRKQLFQTSRRLPRFGTAGQELAWDVLVRNQSGKPQRGLGVMENLEGALESAPETELGDLPPGGEGRVRMTAQPKRRGVLELTAATVTTPEPLGFMKSFHSSFHHESILILPKRYPLPRVSLPGGRRRQPIDMARSACPVLGAGESMEFFSLRDYRQGDPVRRIHWKAWARTGKPIVKEYQDECFTRHALVLDTSPPEGAPRELFEEAVSIAASFAASVRTQDSLLDLLFTGSQMHVATGGAPASRTERMLEALAAVEPAPGRPFAEARDFVLAHVAGFSGCVCVFTQWDKDRSELVSGLSGGGVACLNLVLALPGQDPDLANVPGRTLVLRPGQIQEGLAAV